MKCDQVQGLLPDYWGGALEREGKADVEAHLAVCESCRLDAEMWTRLGVWPAESPSEALTLRLREILAAYRVGHDHAERELARQPWSFGEWLRRWWPAQPAAQFALTMGALVAGCVLGYGVTAGSGRGRELAMLREELRATREMVAVSLLHQQSASDRLRGVNFSYRINQPDNEVMVALIQALKYDTAVDVRLSAVDALRRYPNRTEVRRGLIEALANDQSPMVQAAVIDVLVEFREPMAIPAFERLSKSAAINPVVRRRLEHARQQLQDWREGGN